MEAIGPDAADRSDALKGYKATPSDALRPAR
jgi:hypothetical protein